MKRVLLISFDFPPRRTSGVYRLTGMTMYLSKFGWEPTVLTVKGRKSDTEDPEILERVPSHVRIVRTPYLRVNGWEERTATAIRKAGGLGSPYDAARQPFTDRVVRWLGDLVRSTLYFPDDTVGWVPFGLTKAIELHLKHHFDLVYTSSPPRSALVIGLFLRLLLGVPWVAEFRDPWYQPKGRLRRKFEHWVQLLIMHSADSLVAISKGLAEDFRDTFQVSDEKLAVIRNGFDEEDFIWQEGPGETLLQPGCIHLSHIGTIYPRGTGNFFPALAELVRESPNLKQRLRVNIIGYPHDNAVRYARQNGLEGIVRIRPFVPHREALRLMRSSDLLLIFYADEYLSRIGVPGKFYEYLRVGRPILAVALKGEVKELIEASGAGWVVEPQDIDAIKNTLRTFLKANQIQSPPQPVRPEFVAQFRYDHLADQLARVFDKVSGRES